MAPRPCAPSAPGDKGEVVRVPGDGLRDGAAEGQHGEAAVLQLLDLQLRDALLGLGQEGLAELQVPGVLQRELLEGEAELPEAVGLHERAEDEEPPHRPLAQAGPDELVVRVHEVQVLVLEDVEGQADEVRRHKAQAGEHRHPAVLELCLAVPGQVLGVADREPRRVELVLAPAVVLGAREAAGEAAGQRLGLGLSHGPEGQGAPRRGRQADSEAGCRPGTQGAAEAR
mmetsp:Transcript_92963/g.300621  ORF Transcript_92963/g.300621 Transcript_92963/m.300621 type:complete len:228 (-) Transcript_92963:214-897(-)